jgi:hypothetical protein
MAEGRGRSETIGDRSASGEIASRPTPGYLEESLERESGILRSDRGDGAGVALCARDYRSIETMLRSIGAVLGMMLAAGSLTCVAATAAEDDADVERRIESIKLPESQRKWERIPWVTDLSEGRRLALQQNRPIFLWVTGDDPLEWC